MNTPSAIWLALTASILLQTGAPLSAADGNRLGVTGHGRIEVRPDTMELAMTVSGSSELTADALKKFRANRRRGVDAINKLKVAGLEVKGTGVSVISNAAVQQFQQRFNGGNQAANAGQTSFSEALMVTVPGIDKLSDDQVQDLATKILDAAKDAGLTIGHAQDQNPYYYNYNSFRPQIVSFRLENAEEARQKALDTAAQDAQKKGEQMAKRLNLAIGKPVSARDASSRQTNFVQPGSNARSTENPASESSTALHTIAIDVVLSVEFEILK